MTGILKAAPPRANAAGKEPSVSAALTALPPRFTIEATKKTRVADELQSEARNNHTICEHQALSDVFTADITSCDRADNKHK